MDASKISHRRRNAGIASGVVVLVIIVAGFALNVTTFSYGYVPVKVSSISESTFSYTVLTTVDYTIQFTTTCTLVTTGNGSTTVCPSVSNTNIYCCGTIVTGTYTTASPVFVTSTSTSTTTKTCSLPFWNWLFDRPIVCP